MELVSKININEVNDIASHKSERTISGNCNKSFTQLLYLSKLAAIDIEFNDLTYSVPNSRKGNHSHFIIRIKYQFMSYLINDRETDIPLEKTKI